MIYVAKHVPTAIILSLWLESGTLFFNRWTPVYCVFASAFKTKWLFCGLRSLPVSFSHPDKLIKTSDKNVQRKEFRTFFSFSPKCPMFGTTWSFGSKMAAVKRSPLMAANSFQFFCWEKIRSKWKSDEKETRIRLNRSQFRLWKYLVLLLVGWMNHFICVVLALNLLQLLHKLAGS